MVDIHANSKWGINEKISSYWVAWNLFGQIGDSRILVKKILGPLHFVETNIS